MRSFLLLLFVAYSFTGASQIPMIGLVAYYPFCGNANDMSGNGHHLQNNAISTTNRFNYSNAAFSYNGTTHISYNDTVFNLPNNFTYSCWIVPDTAQNATFLYNGHSGQNGYGLIISGAPVYSIGNNVTVLYGGIDHMITSPVTLHQWHHVVFRKTGTTAQLFIDTVQIGSCNTLYNPPIGKFHIGKNFQDNLHSFLGKVDDVAIYDAALTNAQIVQLYLDHCNILSSVSPANSSVTINGSASFSVVTNANAFSYQWQQNTGSGFINLNNNSPYSGVNTNTLTINPVPASLNNATYRCIITDISCCTDTTGIATLTVTNPVNCHADFVMNMNTVCLGQNIQFTSTSTGTAPLSYYWDFGDGNFSAAAAPLHAYTASGIYTVTHVVTGAGPCSDTIKEQVSVNTSDSVDQAVIICEDSSFVFDGQTITSAGVYTYTFQNANGCDSVVTLTVTISPLPVIDFNFVVVTNAPVQFSNTSVNATNFTWDFGDGNGSKEINPTHLFSQDGAYTVCLTGWSNEGCKAKICKEVKPGIYTNIEVPTAFSPNGDGVNDVLFAKGVGVKEFSLKLYNQWGNVIFQTHDLSKGWNGYTKGEKVNMETVAYVLTATFIDGTSVQKQGNITIVQ